MASFNCWSSSSLSSFVLCNSTDIFFSLKSQNRTLVVELNELGNAKMPQQLYKDLFQRFPLLLQKKWKKLQARKRMRRCWSRWWRPAETWYSNKWWWWWWRWWCDRKFRLQYSQNDNMIPFKYTGTSIKRRPRDWQNMFAITRVSLYRGSFPYILFLLGRKISFVIQRFVKSRFPHCIGVKQRAFLNWLAYKAKTLFRSKL